MEGNDESLYCHGNLIIPLIKRGMMSDYAHVNHASVSIHNLDLRCRARAGLEPAKPARDAARALGNCIARNQDPDSFVIGQFYGSARAFIGSLSVTVAVYG